MGIALSPFLITGVRIQEVSLDNYKWADRVVARLMALQGVYFSVTPLPDDAYAIGVKPEWGAKLLDICEQEDG